ncbi:MAG: Ig-like domain-containing protein [Candidatus Thiodiazotropha sp. (ex Rostrolucina anterorostrata)]|nr:Ig-like domain-containing protein [Candidatus Thiodiazotropha sp. (ex Rostrolucina anterorostrata)]
MSGLARFLIAFTLLFLLAGGGDADAPWDGTTSTGSGQTIDDVGTGQAVILLGSGSGSSFNEGVLSIAVTALSAGGQTTVTATLADADGNLYQDSSSVSFASDCVASGLASMETPIDATGGVATTTYLATGCSGADAIRATATVNGNTTTATGTINVQPAEIGSMEFISAEPSLIGLRGVGLTEVSRVSFRVLDQNGNPVPQQQVNFSLSTDVGGANIPNGAETAVSDVNGLVGTDVKSGTIPTAVRVTASLNANPLIASQSDGLVISTGVSDQNSMSLSTSSFNPEAWGFDGEKVTLTVHAADHFNNPVPDGASVYFTTEGGQIQSQCQIEDGSCSVEWTSSNPRPTDDFLPGGMGRITILSSMLGEESFIDANGNGVFNSGDTAFATIPEAFRDDNEDNAKHASLEEFVDFNTNGIYDGANSDPNYNGALCCDTAAVTAAEAAVAGGEDPGICFGVTPITSLVCSSEKNINVRDDIVLIMAESFARITQIAGTVDAGSSVTFEIVGQQTGQIMPADTAISASLEEGDIDDAYTVPNSSFNARLGDRLGADIFTFNIPADGLGPFTLLVTTPKGNITRVDIGF